MPRIPKLRKHSHRNLCFVEHKGKRINLGPPGPETEAAYARWISEHFGVQTRTYLFFELAMAYWEWQKGRSYAQYESWRQVQKVLVPWGNVPVNDFGPLALQKVREAMIDAGWARKTVNQRVGQIKHCFQWGVSQEMVYPETHAALRLVPGLRESDFGKPDPPPRQPVDEDEFWETIKLVEEPIRTAILVMYFTGCRPSNALNMRREEISTSEKPWRWTPLDHKTRYRGKKLTLWIGPNCREKLKPWMTARGWLFPSPDGNPYTPHRARHYLVHACEELGVHWTMYQLRHSRATALRARYGLETAQAILGHSGAAVTEIYAKPSQDLAREAVEESC